MSQTNTLGARWQGDFSRSCRAPRGHDHISRPTKPWEIFTNPRATRLRTTRPRENFPLFSELRQLQLAQSTQLRHCRNTRATRILREFRLPQLKKKMEKIKRLVAAATREKSGKLEKPILRCGSRNAKKIGTTRFLSVFLTVFLTCKFWFLSKQAQKDKNCDGKWLLLASHVAAAPSPYLLKCSRARAFYLCCAHHPVLPPRTIPSTLCARNEHIFVFTNLKFSVCTRVAARVPNMQVCVNFMTARFYSDSQKLITIG